MFLMASTRRSVVLKKPHESMKFIIAAVCGMFIGFFMSVSLSSSSVSKFAFPSRILPVRFDIVSPEDNNSDMARQTILYSDQTSLFTSNGNNTIYVASNPHGAETLPPGIVVHRTDLYPRRLWGKPSEDLPLKQKYLVILTVGFKQKDIVNSIVSKFSKKFTIMLFHYDGRTSEWDQFEWSERAIHVSAKKQTKCLHMRKLEL